MNPGITLSIISGYFLILFVISFITGRRADQSTFFTANRNSPWYLVAFGMIGASLSGVTFISVPGAVGGEAAFSYFQFILGNFIGYWIIARVLLPLYYRLNLTSIYGYLEQRFGTHAYKSGAVLFLLSRVIGASLRLYLVALVIQLAIGNYLGIPFWLTVFISILLIYLYTFRGGIKTVVWTDTLQTFSMLLGAGITVYLIGDRLELDLGEMIGRIQASKYADIFVWDWGPANNFFKQLLSGALIAVVMTGLDQDMMQKNLTCRSLSDAQKNVYWFSSVFVVANLLFLSLGALLYIYGTEAGIVQEVFREGCALQIKDPVTGAFNCAGTDQLFPLLSLNYLGPVAGMVFVLGVIAAAYSSADSALTALTTSFCVDILGFEKRPRSSRQEYLRYRVHIGFAFLLFLVILIFNWLNDTAVVYAIFTAAGYTYGPLLGLFAFGMYTNMPVQDRWVPWLCLLCPLLSYVIQYFSPYLGYTFGFEILILNGVLMFLGLWISSRSAA